MQRFTATKKDDVIIFTNQFSEEIGQMKTVNDSEEIFYNAEEKFQFKLSRNKVEIFRDEKKIDEFERSKTFGSFQSAKSSTSIKGISSWKGGTKLVGSNDELIVKLNNKSAWVDKGIYKFETFTDVKPFQLALMLHIHIQGSKGKTATAIAASIAIGVIIMNLLN